MSAHQSLSGSSSGRLLPVCLGANICVKTQFDEDCVYIPLDLRWIFLAVPTRPAGPISLVHPVGGHLVRDSRSNACLQCNRTTTTLVLWLYSGPVLALWLPEARLSLLFLLLFQIIYYTLKTRTGTR
ncbi:hypothetical protein EYF80_067143 [Liparis tanakae]|uniref:Uncharacterized protein n=1 Tax=Liparis tanakae TaxID=230148 RepID=A0A4Z2E1V5_9TELE|nr:hypothetical protein EYF80_067143 [Liparis tanakae]